MAQDINKIFADNFRFSQTKLNKPVIEEEIGDTFPEEKEKTDLVEKQESQKEVPTSSEMFEEMTRSLTDSLNSAQNLLLKESASQTWNERLKEAETNVSNAVASLKDLKAGLRNFGVV